MKKVSLVVSVLFLMSCGKHEKPSVTYMPDMHYSPAFKAQEGQFGVADGQMRVPVKGTIPRGFKPYPYDESDFQKASRIRNPLKRTRANLRLGQEYFNIYCKVCHGPFGEGDGSIVPKFAQPPSLQSKLVKGYSDGRLFHIMTVGQGRMPSYQSQIGERERWAITSYIRVLHRAKNPTAADLRKLKNW